MHGVTVRPGPAPMDTVRGSPVRHRRHPSRVVRVGRVGGTGTGRCNGVVSVVTPGSRPAGPANPATWRSIRTSSASAASRAAYATPDRSANSRTSNSVGSNSRVGTGCNNITRLIQIHENTQRHVDGTAAATCQVTPDTPIGTVGNIRVPVRPGNHDPIHCASWDSGMDCRRGLQHPRGTCRPQPHQIVCSPHGEDTPGAA